MDNDERAVMKGLCPSTAGHNSSIIIMGVTHCGVFIKQFCTESIMSAYIYFIDP